MSSDPAYAIDVSFSGDSGAGNMGLESSYDLDSGSSVSEEATLDAQQGILEDTRDLSVSGDAGAAHSYSGSLYSGTATMSASSAGGHLSGYAYLTRQGMHASQSADLSGSQAMAGMALTNQGATASVDGSVTDGRLQSDLSSCTGSANVAGYFSAVGDSVQTVGSAMQGEDQGRLTSTALALDWPTAGFNGWMFASASSQDHATQITQEGELSGGFYRASGQALRSGTDPELRKNRGAYEDTFSTTVNVWTDDLGRYITGLGNYWFVKRGKGIQFILDQTEEGDEVELDSGTFTENIAIDKFLNIYGQGIGFTTIGAKDIGTPVIDITYGGEDTLSVSGLTVAGATKSDGIRFLGSGNTGNVYLSDIKSTGNGNGIDVVATGSGNSVSDVTLQGLEMAGNNYGVSINAKNGGTISDLNFNGPIISNPTGSGVSINNNYGTIRNLNFDGAKISGAGLAGIWIYNTAGNIGDLSFNGATISNAGLGAYVYNQGTVGNLYLNGASIDSRAYGVFATNAGTMKSLNLEGATISNHGFYGIDFFNNKGTMGDLNLNEVKVSGSGLEGIWVQNNGGALGDLNLKGADVLYSKNYGIHVDNQPDKKTGLTSTIGDLNLDGAMIYNSGKNGFYLSNKYGCTARDLRLDGAKISDSNRNGINVQNEGTLRDLSLDRATISGSGYDGVAITTSGTMRDLSLDRAIISDSGQDGVYVANWGTIGGLTMNSGTITGSAWYGLDLLNSGSMGAAAINNANIYGNTLGGIYCGGASIDATNDWWGSASGPYHAVLNPSGTGNSVSDGVTFSPWSATPITGVI